MPEQVVVVDDDLVIVSAITTALRRSGYEVCGAHTVEDALAHLSEREFDVAVIDLVMDGIGGIGLVQHIRAHHPGTSIVVTSVVTGLDSAVGQSVEAANAFLPKPFAPEELRAIIVDVCRRDVEARSAAD